MSATAEATRDLNRKARTPGAISFRTFIRIRLHRHRLDRELASGVDPNVDRLRRERAHELVGEKTRRKLAASLERLLAEAYSAPRPFSSQAPIARAAIRNSYGELETIVERLKAPAYISSQGVAMISLLLTDGAGSLYGNNPGRSEELHRALETVIDTIDHGPVLVGHSG
jgi:hypothetical protein